MRAQPTATGPSTLIDVRGPEEYAAGMPAERYSSPSDTSERRTQPVTQTPDTSITLKQAEREAEQL